MAETTDVAFLKQPGAAVGGMNAAENAPNCLQLGEWARSTNIAIVDGLPTTRPGVIVREFVGAADDQTAQLLAAAINQNDNTGVIATAALNVVNLEALLAGVAGNTIALVSQSSSIVASYTALTGGTASTSATGSLTLTNCTGTVSVLIGTVKISVAASKGGTASVAEARIGNVQGAKFFNPAKGQGGIEFAASTAMVLISIAGRKYAMTFQGVGLTATANLIDISNGIVSNPQLHLVWWGVWENIALAQDGNSACFIWQYPNATTTSAGYNTTNKNASQVPNGGTVMAYSFNRGVVAVLSRFLLASNGLNEVSQTTSNDLLSFSEQSYWSTGQYFAPPTDMGNILAMEILPMGNTIQGQGALMIHCEDGIFSINLNIAPRSSWASTPMVQVAQLRAGAVGPYAVALSDGDQLYRIRSGIQTLRSAAAESSLAGDPQTVISDRVNPFFKNDYPRWLRFSSVTKWTTGNRLLSTCYPIVSGSFRWNRGVVSYNLLPEPTLSPEPAWEGLWTLPMQASGIVQLVDGIFDSQEKQLAICMGNDWTNRLVEFTDWLKYDLLSDGTKQPVSCQIITRGIDLLLPLEKKEFREGSVFFKNVQGELLWGVWVRREGDPRWTLWRAGTINVEEPADDLAKANPWQGPLTLGKVPDKVAGGNQGRYLQCLIRWQGYASLESLRIRINRGDPEQDKFLPSDAAVTYQEQAGEEYDDFEYANGSDWTNNLIPTP